MSAGASSKEADRGPPPLPVPLVATVPEGGVTVMDPLIRSTMDANIDYLLTSCELP